MFRWKRTLLRAVLILLAAAPAELPAQMVNTPLGRAEIIGLRYWTLQRLLDTLAVRRPGVPVDKCAAELRAAGFPDVLVQRYFEDGGFYSLVAVVEPEMAEFVRYRTLPFDSLPPVTAWDEGYRLLEENPAALTVMQGAMLIRGLQDAARDSLVNLFSLQEAAGAMDPVLQFLETHWTLEDLELATWLLAHDGAWRNRLIAAMVLSNFPDHDLAWWSLVDALRDPDGRVSGFAQLSLRYFLRLPQHRQVDWRPVYPALYYLLNGTNLFAFQTVLELLTEIPLPAEVVRSFFAKSGGHMVLAFLGAQHEEPRERAHRFLVATFGHDAGLSPDAWKHIIAAREQQNR